MRKDMGSAKGKLVLAAGGIVIRDTPAGGVELCVIHRPAESDWSLPKGKLEPGETLEECALREVEEETGLVCRIVRFIGTTEYADNRHRPKVVSYWLMSAVGGAFQKNAEVDEMAWIAPELVEHYLTYSLDRELVARAALPALVASH